MKLTTTDMTLFSLFPCVTCTFGMKNSQINEKSVG